MTEAEESAILLRVNKEKQIAALKNAGIELDIETATGTDITNAMKWAGGLLDLCVAAYHKATKQLTFFTKQEWNDLSSNSRYAYITLGVRIRVYSHQWIIGKENMLNDTGGNTHQWAVQNGWNIDELKDYSNPNDGTVWDDFDGEGNTDKIVAYAKANNRSHPAAERVRAYSLSSDDPAAGKYYLPSIAQMRAMTKYRDEIDEMMTLISGSTLIKDWYWSSTEYSSSGAWSVNVSYGNIGSNNSKTYTSKVRPCLKTSSLSVSYPSGRLIVFEDRRKKTQWGWRKRMLI